MRREGKVEPFITFDRCAGDETDTACLTKTPATGTNGGVLERLRGAGSSSSGISPVS